MSRGYTVYRVDRDSGIMEPVGCLLERRDKDPRRYSRSRLIDEARRLFGLANAEFIRIVLDHTTSSRELGETTIARGVLTIRSTKCDASSGQSEDAKLNQQNEGKH
jgi:hypothetical protein